MKKNNRKNILKQANAHNGIIGTFFVTLMLVAVSFSAIMILSPNQIVKADYDPTPVHYTIGSDNVSNVHFDYAIQSDNTTIGVTFQQGRTIWYSTSANGTVWSTPEQVGDDDIYRWEGNNNALNMDYNSTDVPFIVYQEDNAGTPEDLKYAYKDPTWTEVMVLDDPGYDFTYGCNILMASWDDDYPQLSSGGGNDDSGRVYHYNYTGSWNQNLVRDGGSYNGGGQQVIEWDGNLYVSMLDCAGVNEIIFYNSSNWDGSNWGSVEWFWDVASGGHASGITKVNSSGYFLGAIVDDDTGDEVGYYERAPGGAGDHDGVDTGYDGHYSKSGEAEVTQNSTGVMFMSWISGTNEEATQSVHLISSSDGGSNWGDDITVFTHDGTSRGIKIARSTIIDDCVLVFYIDPVATGGDGDLKVAVFGSYEGDEEPVPTASTYSTSGDDSDEFTFSIVSGGTAWTNVTNPGGTLIITTDTNGTDNCTDIYFDATSNLTYTGTWINADTMTIFASTDNSSWDSTGVTINTDGENISLATNWASLSDSADPFPINGSGGAWENVTIYIIVYMDIGSFGAGSYVSSIDWAVKWRVNDYS